MLEVERAYQEFSELLVVARGQAVVFVEKLQLSMRGDLRDHWGVLTPVRVVTQALDVQGGIICAPIAYLAYINPRPEDGPVLNTIACAIQTIAEIARELCRKKGIPVTFLKHFNFRPRDFFSPDYIDSRSRRYGERWRYYRRRLVEAVCRNIRAFLAWLRAIFYQMPREGAGILRNEMEIMIAPHRRSLVYLCDRQKGVVVLLNPSGVGSRSFTIFPGREKVWSIIRLLVEVDTEDGDVRLPSNYNAQFRNTTGDNDGCLDDLKRLLRHIWPSDIHPGEYHLAWEAKPEIVH